mgnify:CR=1 FL=1
MESVEYLVIGAGMSGLGFANWIRAEAADGPTGFAPVVAAEPLPADVCEQLKSERQVLIEAGVPDVVKNGPTWAKANAGPDKVKAARRYIELQEQLLLARRYCPQSGPHVV